MTRVVIGVQLDVLNGGCCRRALHSPAAVVRSRSGRVALACRHDLAVARLKAEAEPTGPVLVDLELRCHAVSACADRRARIAAACVHGAAAVRRQRYGLYSFPLVRQVSANASSTQTRM
jgi:hypothetical protein